MEPVKRPTGAELQDSVQRLARRVEELDAYDASQIQHSSPPELSALAYSILHALGRAFDVKSHEYQIFSEAGRLRWEPNKQFTIEEYREKVAANIVRSKAIILKSIEVLTEDESNGRAFKHPEKVFVVHGHDDGAREAVARYIEKLGFAAVVLHEHANRGRTVIEKFEANSDVGFVVVLLTPDDTGGKAGTKSKPRARQNVLLEWGYFIGKLGRDRVCALKKGEVELPSDIHGIVWETLDEHGVWKGKLAKEMQAAGFSVDWAKVHS